MNHVELRKSFLEFFESKGHKIVPSSSLLPDDPSVLLTTAGMQQFKKYYTGELNAIKDFGSRRTASIQKCFRTSDIEEIGDKSHLSFFEMLGNFSFGPVGSDDPDDFEKDGYFKRSAIHWAYEYITDILEISPERIHVTVFEGDSEAPFDEDSYKIWRDEIRIPENKILKGSRADNFWGPTGAEGPCGPTTEIYVDGIEIWNLVFNEYYKEKSGFFRKLDKLGVDTGMGLERLLSVLNGLENNYQTDVLALLILKISELAPNLDEKIKRILTDHLRAATFLIADGIRPSNKEAGYILRRLLRRILAYQIKYDIHADLFVEIVPVIKSIYGEIYPEIKDKKMILEILEDEKTKFQEVIGRGVREIEKYKDIGGKEAFYLYESFGLPFELIKELAKEEQTTGLKFKDFGHEFKKHQEISRAGVEKKFGGHGLILDTGELKAGTEEEAKKVIRMHTATHLLHWALREIFGSGVKQMGSDINPERFRFDFSFSKKLTTEEIKKIEDLVNEKIKENLPVYFKEMPREDAEKIGALSYFKYKYPLVVKVYFIGSEQSGGIISKEFCGGPHVDYTGEIGEFKILKEEASSAGVRRIRAIVL
ncbi:alanine--tRNA ligase [Candidatus Wolfebacteria bacterium]|nr:alanine--tRNA ligase [Candidatus Wolfebacteria bacterium]